ncbi:MAG TPA: rodlin [Actinocrinis sp.]|nr:rodlin [Actinocrinis sp.]
MNGLLGRTLGTDQIAVENNDTVETSLDSAVLNEDGSATLSGGFTCAQSGAPGTVSTTITDPANGTIWGTATVPVTCPAQVGAVGTWSTTEQLNNSPDLTAAVAAATIPTSPAAGLIQGALNKPCIALPAKANVQSVLALVNVGVQDIPVLSSPQNQQCTENAIVAKGDEALSNILDSIPVLSGNASAGS